MTQFGTIDEIYKGVDDDEKWVYIAFAGTMKINIPPTSLFSRFASRVHLHVSTTHDMIEIKTSFKIEAQEESEKKNHWIRSR